MYIYIVYKEWRKKERERERAKKEYEHRNRVDREGPYRFNVSISGY